MIRGTILFKCDRCGKTFRALDIEYAATVYSTPMPCPHCGSRHTMPCSIFSFLSKRIYQQIWKRYDLRHQHNHQQQSPIIKILVDSLTTNKNFLN